MTPTFETPELYYDFMTRNRSFIHFVNYLSDRGIKNSHFALSLYDKDLMGVDVHSLTEDSENNQKLRIKAMVESKKNGWYFLREVIRILPDGYSPIEFQLSRASAATAWCFFNGIDYISTTPRQTGSDVTALSLLAWVMFSSGHESQIGCFSRDKTSREESVKRLLSIMNFLPSWWISEDKFKDKKNTNEIHYSALKTNFTAMCVQSDTEKADRIARSTYHSVGYFGDIDYCDNIDIIYPTVLASTWRVREKAELEGKPHSNLLSTRIPKTQSVRDRYVRKLIEESMPFTELLYDVENKISLKEIVKLVSKNGMIHGKFNPIELGHTVGWLENQIGRSGLSLDKVLSEYLCI